MCIFVSHLSIIPSMMSINGSGPSSSRYPEHIPPKYNSDRWASDCDRIRRCKRCRRKNKRRRRPGRRGHNCAYGASASERADQMYDGTKLYNKIGNRCCRRAPGQPGRVQREGRRAPEREKELKIYRRRWYRYRDPPISPPPTSRALLFHRLDIAAERRAQPPNIFMLFYFILCPIYMRYAHFGARSLAGDGFLQCSTVAKNLPIRTQTSMGDVAGSTPWSTKLTSLINSG